MTTAPRSLRQRLYRGWMAFSHALGFVMSRIILTIFWVVAIGIYAIVVRFLHLFKKHPQGEWLDIGKHGTMSQQF